MVYMTKLTNHLVGTNIGKILAKYIGLIYYFKYCYAYIYTGFCIVKLIN